MAAGVAYTQEDLEKLGRELIQFMNQEDTWTVQAFSEYKDKSHNWVYEIARDHPLFMGYLNRARKILASKMMKQAMTSRPDPYMLKLHYKRFAHSEFEPVKDWVKEDLDQEAKAKAEAMKAVGAEVDPRVSELIEKLDKHVSK